MGIHIGWTRIYAFMLGSFFAGVSGGLEAYTFRGVDVNAFSGFRSYTYIVMLIVGGMGTLSGAIWGAFLIVSLNFGIKIMAESISSPAMDDSILFSIIKPIVFGLVVLLFLAFQPYGFSFLLRTAKLRLKMWPFKI